MEGEETKVEERKGKDLQYQFSSCLGLSTKQILDFDKACFQWSIHGFGVQSEYLLDFIFDPDI